MLRLPFRATITQRIITSAKQLALMNGKASAHVGKCKTLFGPSPP